MHFVGCGFLHCGAILRNTRIAIWHREGIDADGQNRASCGTLPPKQTQRGLILRGSFIDRPDEPCCPGFQCGYASRSKISIYKLAFLDLIELQTSSSLLASR